MGLAQRRVHAGLNHTKEQLQQALDSRVLIEQAKGALTVRWGVSPDIAFERMRRHARSRRQKLTALVGEIMADPATSGLASCPHSTACGPPPADPNCRALTPDRPKSAPTAAPPVPGRGRTCAGCHAGIRAAHACNGIAHTAAAVAQSAGSRDWRPLALLRRGGRGQHSVSRPRSSRLREGGRLAVL
ncbi:ANTAR domain-containing protein [Streptomyces sp. MNP-20]|uniref:ANTAR domain-containing protein n=1 Tax=Streptomyces sp. MNP-20 TaxID=2721165 RepID=UPI0015518C1A